MVIYILQTYLTSQTFLFIYLFLQKAVIKDYCSLKHSLRNECLKAVNTLEIQRMKWALRAEVITKVFMMVKEFELVLKIV